MKGAVLYDNRDLRVVDIPMVDAGDDGVLIKVKAVGVCGTDVHTYKTGIFKEMSVPQGDGILFGHEFAGDVAAIAPGLDLPGIAVGDRVTGFALGAYAQYCKCDSAMADKPLVFKLPNHISYEEAATVEPLTVSLSAVRRANPQPGENVLIIGAGMIGLGCVQVLKALYPDCNITITDLSEKRLAMAETFGADQVLNVRENDVVAAMKESTGEIGVLYNDKLSAQVDVVIECAGLELTLNQALAVVKPQTGRLVVVALYENPPTIDINQVVTKNIDLLGVLAYTEEDIQESIDLMAAGQVDRKPLISHRFPLAEASAAFEAQLNTSDTLKAVITV